jgi:hypothetical protein
MKAQPTISTKPQRQARQTEVEPKAVAVSNQMKLTRLHYWLTLEGSSGVGFLGLLAGVPFVPVLLILGLAALAFAPFLLKVLIQMRHWGWVTAFAIMVGVPCILWFFPVENPILSVIVNLLPLLMFYLFCWLLRTAVEEWIEE